MNRETLRQMGLTDEQIESVMAEHSKGIQAEKAKAEGYKTDSLKLTELTKQLESLKNAQADKDKDIETKDSQYAELEKQFSALKEELRVKDLKTQLASKGIVGEDADKLVESLSGGGLDVELLGNILTNREQNAVTAKIKEMASNATNPNGGTSGGEAPKSDAEKLAENIGEKLANESKSSGDVLANYI